MPIGTLNEGPLHAALKATYVANGGDEEVPIEGFVADAIRGGVIYEIQTGSFSGLGRKMTTLANESPVVLVHPIAHTTYIVKEEDGQLSARRKSPKHGSLSHIVSELVYLPTLLNHPNFSVEVVLTEEEELRRYDPKKRRRRGGWRTVERRLIEIKDGLRINEAADLLQFLKEDLPLEFTTKDIAMALGESVSVARQFAYCLRHSGVADLVGKKGNNLVYSIVKGALAS